MDTAENGRLTFASHVFFRHLIKKLFKYIKYKIEEMKKSKTYCVDESIIIFREKTVAIFQGIMQ